MRGGRLLRAPFYFYSSSPLFVDDSKSFYQRGSIMDNVIGPLFVFLIVLVFVLMWLDGKDGS